MTVLRGKALDQAIECAVHLIAVSFVPAALSLSLCRDGGRRSEGRSVNMRRSHAHETRPILRPVSLLSLRSERERERVRERGQRGDGRHIERATPSPQLSQPALSARRRRKARSTKIAADRQDPPLLRKSGEGGRRGVSAQVLSFQADGREARRDAVAPRAVMSLTRGGREDESSRTKDASQLSSSL